MSPNRSEKPELRRRASDRGRPVLATGYVVGPCRVGPGVLARIRL